MKRLALVAAISMAVPGQAAAQWTNPYTGNTWNNPVSSQLDTMILHSMQRKMLERSLAAKQGKASAKDGRKPVKPPSHRAASASDFKPGKGHPTVDAFLASSGLDEPQQQALRQVIDATFVAVEGQLRAHNVASALGFAIAASLQIVSGKEVGDDEVRELILGINDLLAANPTFVKLKAADKQQLYDAMIMMGALLITFHTAGESDPKMKETAIEMAKGLLAQLTGSPTAG